MSVSSVLRNIFSKLYATVSAEQAAAGHEVSNLSGGMHAWARAGLPVVAKGGGPGRVA
jgi:rhodanese-related sulfurtransferase